MRTQNHVKYKFRFVTSSRTRTSLSDVIWQRGRRQRDSNVKRPCIP